MFKMIYAKQTDKVISISFFIKEYNVEKKCLHSMDTVKIKATYEKQRLSYRKTLYECMVDKKSYG